MEHGGTEVGARVGVQDILDAALLVTEDLDLRGALDRLVKSVCDLTGARYGALGLVDSAGAISDFVIHGVDDHTMADIGALPTSQGLLGRLVEIPEPIRLADLAGHESALGLPVNHPRMTTFLGVPVAAGDQVLGNLYVTEKAGGAEFTQEDQDLVAVFGRLAAFLVGTARTQLVTERRHQWLEASIALAHAIEDSDDVPGALRQVADFLRQVAAATFVAVIEVSGEVLVAEYCAIDEKEPLDEDEVTSVINELSPVIARVRDSGALAPGVVAGRTAVVVPLPSRLAPGHALVVLQNPAGHRFGVPEFELFSAYADQAALALDRTQGLSERQEHMLVADRDRIARDLHDTVIQRIFATALQLQGLRRTVLVDEVKAKLDESVAELNTTIRDIRSTIFELKRDDATSLKAEVRGLAREYVPVLGFTPFVRLRGAVDGGVPSDVSEQMVATLREALSNVARHADADACVVEVEVIDDWLTLRVSDNGRGITETTSESGLRNVRRRALDLGGTFSLVPEDPHGTLLEWRVPLRG